MKLRTSGQESARSVSAGRCGAGLSESSFLQAASARSARHQCIDEADLEGAVAPDVLARQHHVHRGAYAQQPHGAHGAAKTRVYAELHLRQAQRELAVIHTNPIPAGQRKLQSATQREALQQRYRGAGQCRDPVAQSLAQSDASQCVICRGKSRELVDVGTGNEAAGLAGTDDEPCRWRTLDAIQSGCQFLQHGCTQRVGRLAGNVECQNARRRRTPSQWTRPDCSCSQLLRMLKSQMIGR